MTLVCGWTFARRRTVTGMIQAAGVVGKRHHSIFHRFFAEARWSLDALGLRVFDLLAPWLGDTVWLALDDTLARKRGLKIFGVGMHHDPLLSTRKRATLSWGHSWVVVGVLMQFPFREDRWFCLPVLFRLYLNKDAAAQLDADTGPGPSWPSSCCRFSATTQKTSVFMRWPTACTEVKAYCGICPTTVI